MPLNSSLFDANASPLKLMYLYPYWKAALLKALSSQLEGKVFAFLGLSIKEDSYRLTSFWSSFSLSTALAVLAFGNPIPDIIKMKFFSFVDKFVVGSGSQLVFVFIGLILFTIFEVTLKVDFGDLGGLGDRIGGKTSDELSLCLFFVSCIR